MKSPKHHNEKKQFDEILNRINDGIVAFDIGMNYTYVNKRGGELLNRKPDELIGKNYWKEYPEAEGTPFADAYLKALKTQQTIIIEDYYAPWDRWFENRIYPSPQGLTVFFTEITSRKKAEMEMRHQHDLMNRMMETSPVAIVITDAQGNITYANNLAEKVLGLSKSDITQLGYNAPDWKITGLKGEPIPDEELPFRKVASTKKQVFGIIHAIEKTDGNRVLLSINASPLLSASGEFEGIVASIEDITEKELQEDILRKTERTFSVVFRKAPFSASLSKLPDGIIVEVNEEFEKLFGYSRNEVIGKTSLELGMYPTPEERERMSKIFVEQGFVRNAETKLKIKSGEFRDFIINTDVVDIDGEKHFLTTAQDITEQKIAEQKLNQSEILYRTVARNIPSGAIALFDKNLRFLIVEGTSVGKAGPPKEQVEGRTIWEAFPEDVCKIIEPHYRETLKGNTTVLEVPFGEYIFETHYVPVKDSEGNILAGLVMSYDITNRKVYEDKLRKSEEKFSKLFHDSPYAINLSNLPDGTIQEVNDEFIKSFGYSREEIIGKTSLEIGIVFDEKKRTEILNQLKSKGFVRDAEIPIRTKSGAERILLMNIDSVNIAGTNFILNTALDITKKKIDEKALLDTTEKLRALASHLNTIREEEQIRIARDLHDELGQELTAMKMDISLLTKRMEKRRIQEPACIDCLDDLYRISSLLDGALKTMRRISSELRPEILDKLGLIEAIKWQSDEFSKRTGISCKTETEIEIIELAEYKSTSLFRIFQEILTNAAKHSRADKIITKIYRDDRKIILEVFNNGRPISDEEINKSGSLGIIGIRERVREMNGEFTIKGFDNIGTFIKLKIPVKQNSL